jgi:predicted RNase H-like HicB family nuclease
MQKFTAIIHQCEAAESGFWATCPEFPGANGQGETREKCLEDLALTVKVILELNRDASSVGESEEITLCEASALEGAQLLDRMEEEDSVAGLDLPPDNSPARRAACEFLERESQILNMPFITVDSSIVVSEDRDTR